MSRRSRARVWIELRAQHDASLRVPQDNPVRSDLLDDGLAVHRLALDYFRPLMKTSRSVGASEYTSTSRVNCGAGWAGAEKCVGPPGTAAGTGAGGSGRPCLARRAPRSARVAASRAPPEPRPGRSVSPGARPTGRGRRPGAARFRPGRPEGPARGASPGQWTRGRGRTRELDLRRTAAQRSAAERGLAGASRSGARAKDGAGAAAAERSRRMASSPPPGPGDAGRRLLDRSRTVGGPREIGADGAQEQGGDDGPRPRHARRRDVSGSPCAAPNVGTRAVWRSRSAFLRASRM